MADVKNRYGENVEEAASRTMTLFYLFDKSGSMSGAKIGQVNMAMKDIPKIIKEVSDGNPNSNIEVAAATFSSGVEWITPKPQTPDEFINTWRDIQAEGLTSLGAALKSLNEKMSRKAFLSENPMGYLAPGIIILSDGEPTDDWERPLSEIQKNNWFKNALKVAFAVGDDANKDVLAKICGSKERVIGIEKPEEIRKYIGFVTAVISKTGTMSQTQNGGNPQDQLDQQLQSVDDDKPFVVDVPNIDDDQW